MAIFCSLGSSNSFRTSLGTSFLSTSLNLHNSSLCSFKKEKRSNRCLTRRTNFSQSCLFVFARRENIFVDFGQCRLGRIGLVVSSVFPPLRFRLKFPAANECQKKTQRQTSWRRSSFRISSSVQFDLLDPTCSNLRIENEGTSLSSRSRRKERDERFGLQSNEFALNSRIEMSVSSGATSSQFNDIKGCLDARLGKQNQLPSYDVTQQGTKQRIRFKCEVKENSSSNGTTSCRLGDCSILSYPYPHTAIGSSTNKKDAQTNAAIDFCQYLVRCLPGLFVIGRREL